MLQPKDNQTASVHYRIQLLELRLNFLVVLLNKIVFEHL